MKHASLRSPLAKVRGLGSAKKGTGHFIWQRATALLMIPLTVWFFCPLVRLTAAGNVEAVSTWFASSVNCVFVVLLLLASFYHAKIGMQVVIEDYVHSHARKIILLFLNASILLIAALFGVLSVITLHFHGAI